MPKSHETELNGAAAETTTAPEAATEATTNSFTKPSEELMTKIATVGAIGVVAALFEVALIPGMLIGVGAMLVPAALPKLAEGAQPLFRKTVRGAYKLGQKTRHAFAEAQEQVHDIVAEANAEAVQPTAA